jgi:hypothetical protein
MHGSGARTLPRLLALLALAVLPAALGPLETALADKPQKPPPFLPPGTPDAKMQAAIDAAVEKGADWLRKEQAKHQPNDGSWGGVVMTAGTWYEIGLTALLALALLAAGDRPGDEAVDQALAFCKEKDASRVRTGGRTTYDSGTLLLFVTEYYRPDDGEKKGKGKGKNKPRPGDKPKDKKKGEAVNPCALPEDARPWVESLVGALVGMRKPVGLWAYPVNEEDLSNTQYAFLGLRAARECGAVVPSKVFEEALLAVIDRQDVDGPKVPRTIPASGPGESPYAIDSGDRARGWAYHAQPKLSTGSMTTAAIAVLAICNDALLRPDRSPLYPPELERKTQASVQDGFAWLDKNWSVEKNTGVGAPPWHYYYLYGLERACVFGGRETVGAHDWYIEGAKLLLRQQQEDGRWATGKLGDPQYSQNDLLDTAWAILFLERATRPLPPIRAPVVTEGD